MDGLVEKTKAKTKLGIDYNILIEIVQILFDGAMFKLN